MKPDHAVASVVIVANGKQREIDEGSTIADLLDSIGWKAEWVVVEHNGEPVARARFSSIRLSSGDHLEIVRAVAGGT